MKLAGPVKGVYDWEDTFVSNRRTLLAESVVFSALSLRKARGKCTVLLESLCWWWRCIFFSNTGHFHASLSYLYILSKKKNITKWEVLGNWTQTDGPLTQGQWKRIYRTSRFWLVEGLWGYWRIWHGEECRGVSVQSKWFIWMSLFRASSIQGASIDQKLQSEDTAGHAACRV